MEGYNIPGVQTFPFTKIVGIENITFGNNVIIDDFTFIYALKKIEIGNHVHIACFSSIVGGEELQIGDFAAVSHGSRLLTGTDDFKDWGFGNSTLETKYRNVKRAPINIGRFCIVGANSVVLPGVTIGEGAAVGANSVVTRDLEPWGVYIGNKRVAERNRSGVIENYKKYLQENR